jgi:Chaperone of endosialidase
MKIGIIAILGLLPFVMEAQIVVKPNLNVVIGDTLKIEDGRFNIEAYNKQIAFNLKQIVTDTTIGNQFLYGMKNVLSSETLPWSGTVDGLGNPNPYVRVGIQNEMTTRFGQFVNSIYNYVREKPNASAPGFSQTTGILNKMDTISNQLNGVYNSVRVPNSGDIKLFRNYVEETAQVNTFGVVQGLYNDFEMSGNKSNYGVYNVLKSNDGYAPSNVYDYEVAGVKNILKKSANAIPANLNGFLQKTIGLYNDIAVYGGNSSNGYGVFNLMKITQSSPSNVYGIRTELLPDAGVNTTLGSFLPGNLYGIYSTVDSSLINRPNAYAAVFSGKVLVNGTLLTTSDISLKENITDYKDALSVIKKLTPKTYNIKSEKDDPSRKLHAGLVAQEVELVAPDLVSIFNQPGKQRIKEENIEVIKFELDKDKNGNTIVKTVKTIEKKETKTEDPATPLKVVNYMELIPILMQAIKEQQATIEQLQKDIDKIKVKIGN